MHELLGELPKLRDIYIRGGGPVMTGEVHAIDSLLATAGATAAGLSIDVPPSRGPRPALWLVWAEALLTPLRAAWRAAGRKRLSLKADGPVIKVLCHALAAIDGREYSPEAVASALRRQATARLKRRRNSS
ncbi:MAG: hypothetical protein WA864_08430 [Acetobacteraceae bacterium]